MLAAGNEPKMILLPARVLWGALLGGVVVYAGVAFLIVGRAEGGIAGDLPGVLRTVWLAVTAACLVGWYVFWRKAEQFAATPVAQSARSESAARPQVLRYLLAAWALLEAAAIFGITLYLLTARLDTLFAALLVMVLGMALTFPRAEWFPADRSRPGA